MQQTNIAGVISVTFIANEYANRSIKKMTIIT